jgi:isoleucyl-tRNA synthetase
MKAIEEARAAKTIGGSLEAQVSIAAPEETLAFLRSFGEELRFLFLTSAVTFGGEAAELAVTVRPAAGAKCQRCWSYTEDVSSDPEWPGACARCARAIRQILAESAR